MDARNELYASFAIICWERFRRNVLIAVSRSIANDLQLYNVNAFGIKWSASLKIVRGFAASGKIRSVDD